MIISRLGGGIGNQLFQYAFARCLSHKNNTDLKLDITGLIDIKASHHGYYRMGDFNIQENFATPEDLKSVRVLQEPPYGFTPNIFNCPDDILLSGYWQSDKYFKDIADIIRHEFTLKNPLGNVSSSWKDKILAADCAVSLHVRHGDYLIPLIRSQSGGLSVDYYRTCVNELKKSFPNITVFVFSDDLDWCKDNLKFDVPLNFVEGCEKDTEELYLMNICKHNIIANSTFSWWGAWLNQNSIKKVFRPSPWTKNTKNDHDIIPPAWIRIPVDYDKIANEFPPTLSIILYLENNISTIEYAISNILSQNFKDYEVIIIDASKDNSGEFCRKFANRDNVTLIKSTTDKYKAWNVGMDLARGEYILMLSGKDFVLPTTLNLLEQLLYNYLKIYTETTGNYLSSKSYGENFPNIICFVQCLEENLNGTVQINGLNRNFEVQVDARFKNLNAMYSMKISDADKLILLATQQLNNLIGTKFFKRKFLNEHNIRFDTAKMGGGTELKFLVDAFWHTENMVLIPNLFYGRLN